MLTEEQKRLNALHDSAMDDCEQAFFHLREAKKMFTSAHKKEMEVYEKCDVEPSKTITKNSADSIKESLDAVITITRPNQEITESEGILKQTVRLTIMSHLSDVQELLDFIKGSGNKEANHRINFVKFLLGKYQDTSTLINPNEEFELFIAKHPQS